MKIILAILTTLSALLLWTFGIALPVTIAAAVLKFIGVGFVSGMSYWLPLKLAGAWLLTWLFTVFGIVGLQS